MVLVSIFPEETTRLSKGQELPHIPTASGGDVWQAGWWSSLWSLAPWSRARACWGLALPVVSVRAPRSGDNVG